MPGKTVIEQRVDEFSRDLSAAANEYNEARRYHEDAVARWDEAQYKYNVAKANLETYLATIENAEELERSGL